LSNYGILIASPVSVRLELDDGELMIDRGGQVEWVPIGSLRTLTKDPFQLKLGRHGRRGWELRASGALADTLRGRVGGRSRRLRWGAAKAWHIGLFIATLLAVELVKIPPEWLAPLLPSGVERRLVPEDVRSDYASYCTSPQGELVLRGLLARLDPEIAKSVRFQVVGNEGAFLITGLPGNRLYVSNAFLTTTDPDELAALLAHEVAHLRNNDPVRAALRANGTIGALIGRMAGSRQPDQLLAFSEDEEWQADQQAVSMLIAARISTLPGAILFERMEQERQANRSFGKEQYYMHYGFGANRAKLWRDLPDKSADYWARPALAPEQGDVLFNYCYLKTGPRKNSLPGT
jgi:beta-barrel assembly-enhancing protease